MEELHGDVDERTSMEAVAIMEIILVYSQFNGFEMSHIFIIYL